MRLNASFTKKATLLNSRAKVPEGKKLQLQQGVLQLRAHECDATIWSFPPKAHFLCS